MELFFADVLASDDPIIKDYYSIPDVIRTYCDPATILTTALRTEIGNPWIIGIHQKKKREWSTIEIQLFHDIAARINNILSILLLYKQMDTIAHYDSLTTIPKLSKTPIDHF